MDTQDITRRILFQRMTRFPDSGPDLAQVGAARFRLDGQRLRVAFAEIRAGGAGEAISRVLRFAWTRGLRVQWVVVPQRDGEAELPRALAAAHFRLDEDLLLMAHEGCITAEVNPSVTVVPITTWQAMWEYEHGSRQSFFDDPEPSYALVSQRARERWREQEYGWCRYYVATVDGRIVGGCYVSLFEEIPTLMGVYTQPRARQRGVATSLLVRAVADLVHPGRQVCCLFVKHGNPAEHLYRRLGFVPLVDEHTYEWRPSNG